MASTNGFGNNRLATGFKAPSTLVPEPNHESLTAVSRASLSPGGSIDDAIELSSDDASSEDGGMVINIDDTSSVDRPSETNLDGNKDKMSGVKKDTATSDSKDEDISAPQDTIDRDVEMQLHTENQRHIDASLNGAHDSASTKADTVLRLRDLSEDRIAAQLKYAFFDTSREDVNLDLPVICLTCLTPGHTEQTCPEHVCTHCSATDKHPSRLCPKVSRCSRCREQGHDAESCTGMKITTVPCDLCGGLNHTESSCSRRFFSSGAVGEAKAVSLWISCCKCASKMHLVGDCPDANKTTTIRWSLKPFASAQITNLSLESHTKQMEHEAMNRGMRPEGLKIKGRAGIHTAGVPDIGPQPEQDSDQPFFGPRVRNQPKAEFTFRHPHHPPDPPPSQPQNAHFDRYNPPTASHAQSSRQPNNWYATDSFGQPRSRSPLRSGRRGDENIRRRSRSPRGYDGQRGDRRRSPPAPRDGSRSTDHQVSYGPGDFRPGPPIDPPRQGISIQLPLRRGSSNNDNENKPLAPNKVQTGPKSDAAPSRSASAGSKKKSKKGKANAKKSKAEANSAYHDLVYLHATTTDQIGKPTKSRCAYPIPGHMILVKYLKWISARRDHSGDPPMVLEYDRDGKPLFVDTSAPGLIREPNQRDLESVWLWAFEYFSGPYFESKRDKEYHVAKQEYRNVVDNNHALFWAMLDLSARLRAVVEKKDSPEPLRAVSLRNGRIVPMDG
ncbi:hypothetical protein PV08_00993 [Exophiala spinifera]|uniref:CCHC-type domain-containing protein n=1 Tax=Exophiala spinifera TaxID=91928 RepID=A0A0D2BNA0_9EURO|nr:uncharacterized protein PV08_00993 [Exophiala spinifera]KIW20418.1 hypothetical protein PV08_00993 [Exophiala spinifera]